MLEMKKDVSFPYLFSLSKEEMGVNIFSETFLPDRNVLKLLYIPLSLVLRFVNEFRWLIHYSGRLNISNINAKRINTN